MAASKRTGSKPPAPGVGGSSGNPEAIGHNAAARPLLDEACIGVNAGVTDYNGSVAAARKRDCGRKSNVSPPA